MNEFFSLTGVITCGAKEEVTRKGSVSTRLEFNVMGIGKLVKVTKGNSDILRHS